MLEDEGRRRAAAAPVGRLATVTPAGRPRVVPCCFALEGDTVYSAVDHKPKRSARLARLDDIRAHPAVCLVVDHYGDDWSALWWVRLDGSARVVEEGPDWQRGVDLLVAKYAQYRQRPPASEQVSALRALTGPQALPPGPALRMTAIISSLVWPLWSTPGMPRASASAWS